MAEMGDANWVENSSNVNENFSRAGEMHAAAEQPTVRGALDVTGDSAVYTFPSDDPFEPGAELLQEEPKTPESEESDGEWIPIENWGGVTIPPLLSPKDYLDGSAIIIGGPRLYLQGANGREELAHSIAMTQDLGDKGMFYNVAVDYNGPFGETITSLGIGLNLDPMPYTGDRVTPYVGVGIDYGYKGDVHPDKAFFDNMIIPYGEVGMKTEMTEHVFVDTGCKTVPEGKFSEDFGWMCSLGLGYDF